MPRLGLGSIDISSLGGTGQDVVTAIDDFFFESNASGEVNPILTTSRTNLIPYSNEFTNSSGTGWILSATYALEANSIISPDGTQNATKVTLPSGNGALRTQTISVSPNTRYVFSFFAKRGTASQMKYRVFDFTDPYADIVGKTSYYSQTNTDTWVRIEVPFTTAATTNVISVYIDSDGQGDGYFYAYGAQLEQDGFASAYIPTSGSTVTVSTTLNDTSEVWDFDSTDIMLEADPEDEGFWEEGSNLVLNHDYADLGSELVTDGTFDLGSELAPASDFASDFESSPSSGTVSQSNGTITFDNATSTGTQVQLKNRSISTGKIYQIQFTISNYSSGNFRMSVGNQISDAASANGTYTFYVQYNNGLARNYFYSNSSTLTVSDISLKEVDWDFESSWSISGGKAVYDAAVQGHYLKQTLSSISAGETVKIQFDISDVAVGKTAFLKLEIDGSPEVVFPYTHFSAGTYTYYHKITSELDRLNFVPATSSTGGGFSIDNISIKQVDPNDRWTLGDGWSIEDGKLKSVNGVNYATYQQILTSGTTYEITYTISDYSSGTFGIRAQTQAGITVTANGTYTDHVTSNGTRLYFMGFENFNGSVDNVTVREYAVQPKDI